MSKTETQSSRKPLSFQTLLGIFAVTLVVTGVLVFVILTALLDRDSGAGYTELIMSERGTDGVRPVEPRPVMDFTLPSHTGEALSLSELQGSYSLLYFGYTHCPDVCLLTLSDINKVRELLGDKADEMDFVFISVDGERDTPERLRTYFKHRFLDDYMIGLSGDAVTLRQIKPDYNLNYELRKDEADQNGNYPVDHTASMFLIDPDGQLTTIFAFGTMPETIADYLLERL